MRNGGAVSAAMAGVVLVWCQVSWSFETSPPPTPGPVPVRSLSLREALALASGNNLDVLLSKERIEAAKGQVQTQLGALLPNLAGSARQARQTQFLGTFGLSPVRTDPFSLFDARVTASQNLLSLSLIQRWRASRESLRVTELEAESQRYDVMASAALAYMEGLKALATAQMHDANQRTMDELFLLVKQRLRSGVATRLDIARLEAQVAAERQMASASRYDAARSTFTLLTLLALPLESPVTLTDDLNPDAGPVPPVQGLAEAALSRRPEVQSQITRVKASELTYASITGERVPSLVAQGDYGRIGNRLNTTLDTYTAALLLQVPLFDGGQREGRIAEARSQLRQEALRLKAVVNQVTLEVQDARAALLAAQDQLVLSQAGLQHATKELDLARERYAVVTSASYFELTNGLASVARARENLVDALFQLNAARIHLARSMGTLDSLN